MDLETIAFQIPEFVIVREHGEIAGIALGFSQALDGMCHSGILDRQDDGLVARLQVTPEQKQRVLWMLENKLHVPLLEASEEAK